HTCSECGHNEAIFGSGGGDAIAAEYGMSILAKLPLSMAIREQSDGGKPPVLSDPDGEIAGQFREIAKKIHGMIDSVQQAGPRIHIMDD
ncbi:MAG: ATP-binding protein involved in chromosome partitioning, partial [Litorivivens sp.]